MTDDLVTVTAAATAGNHRAMLTAMRDRVARTVDDPKTPARDLAALTRRLMDIAREISVMDAADAEDDIGRALTLEDEDFDPEAG